MRRKAMYHQRDQSVKDTQINRSKPPDISKMSENSNPNLTSPGFKSSKSPAIKSATKTHKSPSKNPTKIRERKFMVAKRNSKKEETDSQKSLYSAYESLASQEGFFKNGDDIDRVEEKEGEKRNPLFETLKIEGFALNRPNCGNPDEIERSVEMGSSEIKGRSVPGPGSGKVMNLVKAFERLHTTTPKAKDSENSNPNLTSPSFKYSKSPAIKSATKTHKSPSKNPTKIRERKLMVAKRNSNKEETDLQKSLYSAYESLRASQEGFFKNGDDIDRVEEKEGGKRNPLIETLKIEGFALNLPNCGNPDEIERSVEMGSSEIKGRSVPGPGSGKVMNLVKAFERLHTTTPKAKDSENSNPNLTSPSFKYSKSPAIKSATKTHKSPSKNPTKICERKLMVAKRNSNKEETDLQKSLYSAYESLRASQEGFFKNGDDIDRVEEKEGEKRNPLIETIKIEGFALNRPNCGNPDEIERSVEMGSSEIKGRSVPRSRRKKRQLKATSQKPFELLTEQRGRNKEEEFSRKVQQMMTEEEKQRIPIAQGLPLTTDEPQCLVKPPVKESTMPVDLMLHSDVRAVERTEFDQQVAGKMSIIEQYKMERERQQKLAEEEEIRRLRKELNPCPILTGLSSPRRSLKHPYLTQRAKVPFTRA